MSVTVALLSAYSLALLGSAQILGALGRRSTSPWTSRTLAGHRRATDEPPAPLEPDAWPHSEVPRLYSGIAVVAAVAAGALCVASLTLDPPRRIVGLPLAILALAVLSVFRTWRSLR